MLLHTITAGRPCDDWDFYRFVHFVNTEIFPGGDVPPPELVMEQARMNGFEVVHVESLRPHYAHAGLLGGEPGGEAGRGDRDGGRRAVRSVHEVPDRLRDLFRGGETNLHQFKLRAN